MEAGFGADGWNGERLFQAARFITEMEYQHIVFEEFARKIQPAINPFEPFAFTQTEINPADEGRVRARGLPVRPLDAHRHRGPQLRQREGPDQRRPLLDAFLNPPAYNDGRPQRD